MKNLTFIIKAGASAFYLSDVKFNPVELYNVFSKLDFGKVRVYDVFVADGDNIYRRFMLVSSWHYKFPHIALLAELGKQFGEPINLNRDAAMRLDLAHGTWLVCRPQRIQMHYLNRITRASRSRLMAMHYMYNWPISIQKRNNVYTASSLELCLSHSAWNIHFPPEYLLDAAPVTEETLKTCLALYVQMPSLRRTLFEYLLSYSFDMLKEYVDNNIDDLRQVEAGLRDALQITLFKETPLFE